MRRQCFSDAPHAAGRADGLQVFSNFFSHSVSVLVVLAFFISHLRAANRFFVPGKTQITIELRSTFFPIRIGIWGLDLGLRMGDLFLGQNTLNITNTSSRPLHDQVFFPGKAQVTIEVWSTFSPPEYMDFGARLRV